MCCGSAGEENPDREEDWCQIHTTETTTGSPNNEWIESRCDNAFTTTEYGSSGEYLTQERAQKLCEFKSSCRVEVLGMLHNRSDESTWPKLHVCTSEELERSLCCGATREHSVYANSAKWWTSTECNLFGDDNYNSEQKQSERSEQKRYEHMLKLSAKNAIVRFPDPSALRPLLEYYRPAICDTCGDVAVGGGPTLDVWCAGWCGTFYAVSVDRYIDSCSEYRPTDYASVKCFPDVKELVLGARTPDLVEVERGKFVNASWLARTFSDPRQEWHPSNQQLLSIPWEVNANDVGYRYSGDEVFKISFLGLEEWERIRGQLAAGKRVNVETNLELFVKLDNSRSPTRVRYTYAEGYSAGWVRDYSTNLDGAEKINYQDLELVDGKSLRCILNEHDRMRGSGNCQGLPRDGTPVKVVLIDAIFHAGGTWRNYWTVTGDRYDVTATETDSALTLPQSKPNQNDATFGPIRFITRVHEAALQHRLRWS